MKTPTHFRAVIGLLVVLTTLGGCRSKSHCEQIQRQNDSLHVVVSRTKQLLYDCQNADDIRTQQNLEKLLNQLEHEMPTTIPMPARPR